MKFLLTGFEPFDKEPINPSWEVVNTLPASDIPGAHIFVEQLPTVFGRSFEVLRAAIERVNPDVVICVGQAGGRSAISFERIGVNMDDARIPDNEGNQPEEQPIVPGGPAAYWSNLPIRKLVERLKEEGIPAAESLSAGTYVCNHTLYQLMHLLASEPYRDRKILGGFIHIPYLPSQAARHANAPSLSADIVKTGLEIVIRELVNS
jgi:pyroglutamyl-peptidase